MNLQYVKLPELLVKGYSTRTNIPPLGETKTTGELWREFYENGASAGIPGALSDTYKSLSVSYDKDKKTGDFNSLVGCIVDRDTSQSEGFAQFVIPAREYAKVTVENANPDSISNIWSEIIFSEQIARTCNFDIEIKAYKAQAQIVDILISTI